MIGRTLGRAISRKAYRSGISSTVRQETTEQLFKANQPNISLSVPANGFLVGS